MISQFAVGILAHSSDAKILSKYFGEPRIADILRKQNIGKISQTSKLSQMLFSRLIGRIFKKQNHNNSSKFRFIQKTHAELLACSIFIPLEIKRRANNTGAGQIVGKNMGIAETSIKSVHCFCSKDPHPLVAV